VKFGGAVYPDELHFMDAPLMENQSNEQRKVVRMAVVNVQSRVGRTPVKEKCISWVKPRYCMLDNAEA